MVNKSVAVYGMFFVLSVLGVHGKPSVFTINVSSFSPFNRSAHKEQVKKEYSGRRIKNDSILMVYLHDQTIAIVEVGPDKLLLNCELIEIPDPEDALYYLGKLKNISKPLPIFFGEMIKLMAQCQELDAQNSRVNATVVQNRTILGGFNPLSIFRGIIPGTRWCGTGDVAVNYYDLGEEPEVDRCCRTHDLCPVKIGPYTTKYNLTNDAIYTKSHCICDDYLFNCLKNSVSNTARIMDKLKQKFCLPQPTPNKDVVDHSVHTTENGQLLTHV